MHVSWARRFGARSAEGIHPPPRYLHATHRHASPSAPIFSKVSENPRQTHRVRKLNLLSFYPINPGSRMRSGHAPGGASKSPRGGRGSDSFFTCVTISHYFGPVRRGGENRVRRGEPVPGCRGIGGNVRVTEGPRERDGARGDQGSRREARSRVPTTPPRSL